ncbi:hypothetical protein H7Y29_01720 [Microbacteriaceae bacterium]|nr:hypothetical protein [Candidatus Saccharibacteria bacterium]
MTPNTNRTTQQKIEKFLLGYVVCCVFGFFLVFLPMFFLEPISDHPLGVRDAIAVLFIGLAILPLWFTDSDKK